MKDKSTLEIESSVSRQVSISSKHRRKHSRSRSRSIHSRRRKKSRRSRVSRDLTPKSNCNALCTGCSDINPKESCETICTPEYLGNKFNLLRVVVLIITIILLGTSILYSVGSVLTLELSDIWCPEYTWEEIVEHNRENNNPLGEGDCYVTGRLHFNDEKLFATDLSENGLTVASNVYFWSLVKCTMFLVLSIILIYVFLTHSCLCLIDFKKTWANEWYVHLNLIYNMIY